MKNVNKSRLGMLIAAVFIYIFASDFLIHQVLLKGVYQASAHLWRTEVEIQNMLGFMFLGQILIAVFFSLIFVHNYEGRGAMEGVRYGALVGGLMAAPNFVTYAVMPVTMDIFLSWVVTGFIQCVLGGVVAALVYRR